VPEKKVSIKKTYFEKRKDVKNEKKYSLLLSSLHSFQSAIFSKKNQFHSRNINIKL